jgi:hypothetical protein
MGQIIMPDKTKWTVHVKNWTWEYVFAQKGTVRWTDPMNGMHGAGTWKLDKDRLITRWFGSKTWEEWDLPITPSAQTGTCHMEEGNFKLTAVATNYIKLGDIYIYARTPESKAHFLELCSEASGSLQVAQLHFSKWLSSISIAYGDAFEAHNKLMDDIKAIQRLAQELLLGFALAFLGGGVGGVVGAAMKKAGSGDFMIDGVKDLAKFAVRGPGAEAFRRMPVGTGGIVSPMPTSPLQWQNGVNKRVASEMEEVAKIIRSWRLAVANDDSSFNAGFDPVQEVEKALVIAGTDGPVAIEDLPDIDEAQIQKTFQKGFLAAWIPVGAKSTITYIPIARELCVSKIIDYGKAVGLSDVEDQLEKYSPTPPPTYAAGF